jgi:hypothetical protein
VLGKLRWEIEVASAILAQARCILRCLLRGARERDYEVALLAGVAGKLCASQLRAFQRR